MQTHESGNILAHQRTAKLPLETPQGTFELQFTYSRNQVAQLVMELSSEGDRFEISRRWLLAGVASDQKETLLELLNHPDNFTLEIELMGALTPFLANNQAVIGTLSLD